MEYTEVPLREVPQITEALLAIPVGDSRLFERQYERMFRSAISRISKSTTGREYQAKVHGDPDGILITCTEAEE